MWICLTDSFVSVVQDGNDLNRMVVRGRRKEHLQALFPEREILLTPDADYVARILVTREEFASLVNRRITEITYDNFKGSVADPALHDLYADFWSLHRRYQENGGQRDRSGHFAWGPGDIQFTPKV